MYAEPGTPVEPALMALARHAARSGGEVTLSTDGMGWELSIGDRSWSDCDLGSLLRVVYVAIGAG